MGAKITRSSSCVAAAILRLGVRVVLVGDARDVTQFDASRHWHGTVTRAPPCHESWRSRRVLKVVGGGFPRPMTFFLRFNLIENT